jgi:hypothetical protein
LCTGLALDALEMAIFPPPGQLDGRLARHSDIEYVGPVFSGFLTLTSIDECCLSSDLPVARGHLARHPRLAGGVT